MGNKISIDREEYEQCGDCINKNKCSPCPCDSCEQKAPTNFTEEE